MAEGALVADRLATAIEQLQLNQQQLQARVLQDGERALYNKRVQRAVGTVTRTDGAIPANARKWLREMDASRRDLDNQATVELAAATAMGRLRVSMEDFITAHVQGRNQVPWLEIAAHIRVTHLGPDEDAFLRATVDEICQGDYEEEEVYLARFLDAAAHAYPPPRGDLQHHLLVDRLVKGLTNSDLALELLTRQRPATIEEAAEALKRGVDARKRLARLRPAPIAAVAPPPKEVPQPTGLEVTIATLVKDVSRLSSKFGELTKARGDDDIPAVRPTPPSVMVYSGGRSRGGYRGRGRGRGGPASTRGFCYVCGSFEHYARDCPQRYCPVSAVTTNPFLQGNGVGGAVNDAPQ